MRKIIKLEGLCCANCASKIETEVSKLAASLSFMTQRLTMEVEDDRADAIVEESRKIAYKIEPEAEFKVLR